MPPIESQGTPQNKKILKIGAIALAVMVLLLVGMYAIKAKQAIAPVPQGDDIATRMREHQVPPLTPAEQAAIEKRMSETTVPALTVAEKQAIEKRMSETVVPK